MPNPTHAALKKQPQAIVMLDWEKDKVANGAAPGNRDFDWLVTDKGRDEHWNYLVSYSQESITNYGDLVHVLVEVLDTEALTLGRVAYFPDTSEDLKAYCEKIAADPKMILAAASAKKAPAKKATVKPTEVKARGKSSAASVVRKGGAAKGEAAPSIKPKVTPKGTTKKAAVKPKEDTVAAAAEKLKNRLAAKAVAKKAAAKPETAALDEALAASGD